MLTLTNTMLNKSIIDANAEVRAFALTLGIDYEQLQPGEKIVVPARWPNGEPTEIRFYRTAGKRSDRRVSIKELRKMAEVGDTITATASAKSGVLLQVVAA